VNPLAGRGILITRPAHQAASLAERVHAAGGEPILFPALEIAALADAATLDAVIDRLDDFDWAVFVSPNAASMAMGRIRVRRAWPARLRAAAIGRGTTRELARSGVEIVVAPSERFDTEALLAQPELQAVAGQHVVIFRGDGGRELLGDTLAARGARVEYAECYRRVRPAVDPQQLARLLARWERGEVHAVTAASAETLRNLCEMVGISGEALLRATPLFVPHERIAQAARELGIPTVVTAGPGEDGLLDGLASWFGGRA
jgi:uroporphyrinogen-III synthase